MFNNNKRNNSFLLVLTRFAVSERSSTPSNYHQQVWNINLAFIANERIAHTHTRMRSQINERATAKCNFAQRRKRKRLANENCASCIATSVFLSLWLLRNRSSQPHNSTIIYQFSHIFQLFRFSPTNRDVCLLDLCVVVVAAFFYYYYFLRYCTFTCDSLCFVRI